MGNVTRDSFSGADILEQEAVDTFTTTQLSAALDLTDYVGNVTVILHSEEGTGNADNTLNVQMQESATSGGTYTNITGAAFTEVDDTAGGSLQILKIDADAVLGFTKSNGVIAGTTPSFIYGISVIGRKQVV